MKIVYLTAGAAGMFCGSCMNDNALARQLIRMGHECLLTPVYTPIRTDEDDVSIDRVFMGGLNVYLQQKLPFLSYLPSWVDGFLNQPWIINPLTKNAGKTSPSLLGALTVSMLRGTEGRQRKEFNRLLDWLAIDVQPDIVILTNLLIGGCIPDIKKRTNAKVYVTLQGDDIFLDSLPSRYRSPAIEQMKKLAIQVDGFIAHSNDYATRMTKWFDIDPSKMHVVPLGIDVTDFLKTPDDKSKWSKSDNNSERFTIGYFARMAPEKGLHRIVDAFIAIANRDDAKHVVLKLAGWMGPQHHDYWNEQKQKLDAAGLSNRYEYVGSIDRNDKNMFLRSIDLFCVPTVYEEPKGLFLLEAIATGVPYVQPDHGAFPEIHARIGRGKLFDSKSDEQLREVLLQAISEHVPVFTPPEDILSEIDIKTHAQRIMQLF